MFVLINEVCSSLSLLRYDGNRCKAWNGTDHTYGSKWETGDVVTCYLDLDEGTISYSLNGDDLGAAFTSVGVEGSIAEGLFPAVSLEQGEATPPCTLCSHTVFSHGVLVNTMILLIFNYVYCSLLR